MQSVVPDIFDNHSLAPNIKLRDNLDYGPLEGESNSSAAYMPSYQRPDCVQTPRRRRPTSAARADVRNISSAFKLNLYLIQIAKGNEEYAVMKTQTAVGPYSMIIR